MGVADYYYLGGSDYAIIGAAFCLATGITLRAAPAAMFTKIAGVGATMANSKVFNKVCTLSRLCRPSHWCITPQAAPASMSKKVVGGSELYSFQQNLHLALTIIK